MKIILLRTAWAASLVLLIIGVLGLFSLNPAVFSNAFPYHLLHLVLGTLGIGTLVLLGSRGAPFFLILFGFMDIFQLFASVFIGPLQDLFLWTWIDDVLHFIIGTAMLAVGILSIVKNDKG